MKKIVLLILLFKISETRAQFNIDSISNMGFIMKDTISDKLADFALGMNPSVQVADKQIEVDLYEWKKAKSSWGSNITASFNLNEGNLRAKDSTLAGAFFPRYNLNLAIPFSSFTTRPKETKRAKAQYEGSQAEKQVQNNKLRQDIKATYQDYIANRYLLALQEAVLQDESLLLSLNQKKFEANQISLEVFTNSTKRYNLELVKRITLQRDINTSKILLEGLLGASLETALQAINPPATGN